MDDKNKINQLENNQRNFKRETIEQAQLIRGWLKNQKKMES